MFFTVGVLGTVLPALPGATLIWLGMLVYGFFVKFQNLPWTFYAGQGLAVLLIFLVDYLAGIWGVRRYGGSREAVWGSVLGGLLGVLLLGPFGLIFGPFIGAVAGELYRRSPLIRPLKWVLVQLSVFRRDNSKAGGGSRHDHLVLYDHTLNSLVIMNL